MAGIQTAAFALFGYPHPLLERIVDDCRERLVALDDRDAECRHGNAEAKGNRAVHRIAEHSVLCIRDFMTTFFSDDADFRIRLAYPVNDELVDSHVAGRKRGFVRLPFFFHAQLEVFEHDVAANQGQNGQVLGVRVVSISHD